MMWNWIAAENLRNTFYNIFQKTVILNYNNIRLQYFDQINSALASIRHFQKQDVTDQTT